LFDEKPIMQIGHSLTSRATAYDQHQYKHEFSTPIQHTGAIGPARRQPTVHESAQTGNEHHTANNAGRQRQHNTTTQQPATFSKQRASNARPRTVSWMAFHSDSGSKRCRSSTALHNDTGPASDRIEAEK
jgi:hypothetical protein